MSKSICGLKYFFLKVFPLLLHSILVYHPGHKHNSGDFMEILRACAFQQIKYLKLCPLLQFLCRFQKHFEMNILERKCLYFDSNFTEICPWGSNCHFFSNGSRNHVMAWRLNNDDSSPPGQNGRLFVDDIFRCIFVNEMFCILIKISLKFVPKGPTDNNPPLVQIMAWCWIGDKPLSEPMLTSFTGAYM